MRLEQLRSLAAIVRQGSFTRAAEQLFLTQPSLSQQIRQLETELGVELLDRSGRSVTLTQAGEQLYPRIARMLAEERCIERHAAELRGDAETRLSVAMVPVASERVLPSVFHAFTAECARTLLDISEHGSEGVAERIRSGFADIGIAAWSPRLPNWYQGVRVEHLTLGRVVACVPADSPLAAFGSIRLNQLEGHALVLFREGYLTRDLIASVSPFDLRETMVLSTDNSMSARHMVAAGLGVAFLQSIPGEGPEPAWYGTRTVQLIEPDIPIGLCIVTARKAHLTQAGQTFIRLVRRFTGDLDANSGETTLHVLDPA